MKILIDNGHGVETPGKRSPDGRLREYSYTRQIARSLVKLLKDSGYDAALLVKEDSDIPLKERVRRVNDECSELGSDEVLLVSIHCNASGSDGQWHFAGGWSAYTAKGVTRSDKLAYHLYRKAVEVFPLKGKAVRKYINKPLDEDFEEDFFILRNTKCTAVLTENFFQDNKNDVNYLLSDEGKDDIIKVHFEGIKEFLNDA